MIKNFNPLTWLLRVQWWRESRLQTKHRRSRESLSDTVRLVSCKCCRPNENYFNITVNRQHSWSYCNAYCSNCQHYLPAFNLRKTIADNCENAASHTDIAADSKHKQHNEESHREELRNEIDFRNRLGISHESQRNVAGCDFTYVNFHHMCQMTKDSEDDKASKHRRWRVKCSDDVYIPEKVKLDCYWIY